MNDKLKNNSHSGLTHPIRVMIVDDSDFVREFIASLFSEDKNIRVVAEAGNGLDAVRKVKLFKPDLITMDINMPVMNGLDAIEEIMAFHPIPILVITSDKNACTAYSAISKGALEVLPKPDLDSFDSADFINKVKSLSKVKVISHIRKKTIPQPLPDSASVSDKIIGIASSTGGPKALSVFLSELPENFPCPILIAQHIADDFAPAMVDWLRKESNLTVKIGDDGETVKAGTVYVSPSEKHMKIVKGNRIDFEIRKAGDIYYPSCNVLLSSIAEVYRKKAIGVILTGMGNDGMIGIKAIGDAGGMTIAQDKNSSVVFGMPKAAIDMGYIQKILPLQNIANEIIRSVMNECFQA